MANIERHKPVSLFQLRIGDGRLVKLKLGPPVAVTPGPHALESNASLRRKSLLVQLTKTGGKNEKTCRYGDMKMKQAIEKRTRIQLNRQQSGQATQMQEPNDVATGKQSPVN